ncbi:MAG: hypothetical protein J2P44_11460 [Candidatus Dormibacteraeota bacterium]|nr:hypothetical protein [Candidatus Dormibacteraeota bacterium]MBO0708969.1 hypothetical protein [Candidatus Dormibacteraeota bacterium]
MQLLAAAMPPALVANPQTIVGNLEGLAALVVILIAGLVAITHMARHRILGLIVTIAGAALVYLAITGRLIPDVSTWFQQIGL